MCAFVSGLVYLTREEQEVGIASQGLTIIPELTDDHRTTFFHSETGKVILAFRGTRLSSWADLAADLAIIVGVLSLTARYHASCKAAKRAIGEYGLDNVTVTGHSLGGALALAINRRLGTEAHAFNPGAGPCQLLSGIFQSVLIKLAPESRTSKRAKRSTIHSTMFDPLSIMALVGPDNKVYMRPNRLNVHSIDNFPSLGWHRFDRDHDDTAEAHVQYTAAATTPTPRVESEAED